MTEQETKEYLQSIQRFRKKNHDILVQIMELRAVAESCTVRTDKESIQTSGSGDKMANIVGRIVDLEKKIERSEEIIRKRRSVVDNITQSMPDKRQVEFLTIRYIDGNGLYDTAMLMDLSDSTAKRVHRKAIAEFTKIYNEKHGHHTKSSGKSH